MPLPPCPDRDGGRRRRPAILWTAAAIAAVALSASWALDRAVRRAGDNLRIPPASTVVLDRDGRLLRPFATREGRWSLPVSARDVDPRFIALLLAVEDGRFAAHGGIDPRAALRAAGQWALRGRVVSGASTLSMQVARLLAPRGRRTLRAKAGQALRALALERRFSKPEILDLYLRLAPYGGTLGGMRAASLAWFGHEPKRLDLAEAALLVALPQSPERRRPDRFPEAARRARDRILDRAAALGLADAGEAARAAAEPVPDGRRALPALAFHAAGEARAGTPPGSTVRLTLDAALQAGLEPLVLRQAARFGPSATGALIVVDDATGEVLADVGTADPRSSARAGGVDMARALRSPGSALKPFIYAMAFEEGIAAPETVLEDRQTHYGSYGPGDFDRGFTGSVSAWCALQQSLNLPAVALLDRLGPSRFVQRLRDAGTPVALPRGDALPPGLAVALGGLGIRLVDLVRLYAGLARGGGVPPLVERRDAPERPVRPLADAASAWAVGEILRGAEPPPNALPGRIAFKTGTSYGFRDALAVGYDRRFTVAAWLGRADGGSVPGLVGRQAAGPLLFDAFARLPGPPDPPPRPPGARILAAAALPPPLRRLAPRPEEGDDTAPCRPTGGCTGAPRPAPALRIAYPPDGATVDLGLAEASSPPALALKAEGGAPPFTWFVDGLPAGPSSVRRETRWLPPGRGFAHLSVIDAAGREATATVRLQ